jgi:hypothetical protein
MSSYIGDHDERLRTGLIASGIRVYISGFSCGIYPAFLPAAVVMLSIVLRRASARQHVQAYGQIKYIQGACRNIQTTSAAKDSDAEAYLEEARPGIVTLALNRPKAKNAISRRLLQVWYTFDMSHSSHLI